MASNDDLQVVCALLQAVQSSDGATRKEAERAIDEKLSSAPEWLVRGLATVLASVENGHTAPEEMRQQAAVLLRQCVRGRHTVDSVWEGVDKSTQQGVKEQLLKSIQEDANGNVRRNAGSVVSAIAEKIAEDFDDLTEAWPALLPTLSSLVGADKDIMTRVTALTVLKSLASLIGDGLIAKGGQVVSMLQSCLTDSTAEVRAAAAQLALELIENLEEQDNLAVLATLIPAIIAVLQGFITNPAHEDSLKATLEALISAIDEEPEFFKQNGLEQLWAILLQVCAAQHFTDADVRHSAMETIMSFVVGLADDFAKPEGHPMVEQLVAMNLEWMLEVSEDIDAWTSKNKEIDEDDDDELDGGTVQIGEENFDRLAEKYAELDQLEDVFLPIAFKVIRAVLQAPSCSWKQTRSCIMAVAQVVEHIQEEPWIDQCVEFIAQHLDHAHPRVKFAGYHALAQIAYDHEPYVQDNHSEMFLGPIVQSLDDANIRVAANAAAAFSCLGEDLDFETLEPYMDDLMTRLFAHLQKPGQTRAMQAQCLSCIAVASSAAEEAFLPYYKPIMPFLKQLIASAADEKEQVIRGKAFECASLIGSAVGKEAFLVDAREIMAAMAQVGQNLAPENQTREYILEATGRIAETLEKDFKPFVSALLPGVVSVLAQRPSVVDPEDVPDSDDEEGNDMSLMMVGDNVLGLKTTALDEMQEAMTLIATLMKALEDEFCEFLPTICQCLLPLLEFPLSDSLRGKCFRTWEAMILCARSAAESGKIEQTVLRELAGGFLKETVAAMAKAPEGEKLNAAALGTLQAQAVGVSAVVEKAGKGVLQKDDVAGLAAVIVQLLGRIAVDKSAAMEASTKKRGRHKAAGNEDIDDEDEYEDGEMPDDGEATRHTVRIALANIAGALMRTNREEFAEVGLPQFMEGVRRYLQPECSEGDKTLALYIAGDTVEFLGDLSIPYWQIFMEQALRCVTDKCSAIRQHACTILGHGAKLPVFAEAAPAAARQLALVLQKQGDKHRRRRAVTSDAKQDALAVDSAIRAFGLLCEHQETNIGGDAASAWKLFITNLPLRYDKEEGRKAHAQLLALLTRNHPVVAAEAQLPKVLGILGDVYDTKFSNTALDNDICAAMAVCGEEALKYVQGLPERQRKKIETMLKAAGQDAGQMDNELAEDGDIES